MNVRPLAAAAIALSCAFATPSSAGRPVGLDGARRTHVTYAGTVSDPTISPNSTFVEADRNDCTTASCDVTPVRLTLPAGSAGGRFKAVVTTPPQLSVAVGLYDARGTRLAYSDLLGGSGSCCAQLPYMEATFTVARLPAGTYSLVVFDRAGQGDFTVDLDYKANPPARQSGKN